MKQNKKKPWVAKISDNLGRLHTFELSPHFKTAQECIDYIDTNKEIKEIEEHLKKAFNKICWMNNLINLGGSFIRAYNVVQKRWVDGFDV